MFNFPAGEKEELHITSYLEVNINSLTATKFIFKNFPKKKLKTIFLCKTYGINPYLTNFFERAPSS